MRRISTFMFFTCILWYAAISTMNTYAIVIALIATFILLPLWAYTKVKKISQQPGKGYFESKYGVWGGLIPYVAILLIVLAIFVVKKTGFTFPFLNSTAMPYKGPVRYVDTTNGNETANLVNGGTLLSTTYDELFTNLGDGGKIYSVSMRERGLMRRSEDSGSNFCVFSDYVYYINHSDHDAIYRMSMTDAKAKEKLVEDAASQFCIAEMIYYINKNDKNRIYRTDTDGKHRVRLGTKSTSNLFQLYGNLYYLNLEDGGRIYRMTSEGKKNKKLVGDRASEMFYTNGRLYYINLDDNGKIYSVKDSGEDRKKECDDRAGCICSDRFFLYYSNLNDEGRIYKLELEKGGAAAKLNDDTNCEKINVNSNHITYISNGVQKFAEAFNGAPAEDYYPKANAEPEEVETIQIPPSPVPPGF